jgi:hypothetical protein
MICVFGLGNTRRKHTLGDITELNKIQTNRNHKELIVLIGFKIKIKIRHGTREITHSINKK